MAKITNMIISERALNEINDLRKRLGFEVEEVKGDKLLPVLVG